MEKGKMTDLLIKGNIDCLLTSPRDKRSGPWKAARNSRGHKGTKGFHRGRCLDSLFFEGLFGKAGERKSEI